MVTIIDLNGLGFVGGWRSKCRRKEKIGNRREKERIDLYGLGSDWRIERERESKVRKGKERERGDESLLSFNCTIMPLPNHKSTDESFLPFNWTIMPLPITKTWVL